MEFAAVFVLPLIGGYLFAMIWRYTRYSIRRADGHHLYFRAALIGVGLFGLALFARLELGSNWPSYKS